MSTIESIRSHSTIAAIPCLSWPGRCLRSMTLLLPWLFATIGCTTTTHHADATVVHHDSFISVPESYAMTMPEIDLANVGTHVFEVRDLPIPMYPQGWTFPTRSEAMLGSEVPDPRDAPWSAAVVAFTIRDLDGQSLFSVTYRLGEIANVFTDGYSRGGGFFQIGNGHERLPQLLSYDVLVNVIEPAPRHSRLKLRGLAIPGVRLLASRGTAQTQPASQAPCSGPLVAPYR